MSKLLVIGECKYRESFDETAEVADLEGKRDLVRGYTASNYVLFTKHEVGEATREKLAGRSEWRFVTLDEMYGGSVGSRVRSAMRLQRSRSLNNQWEKWYIDIGGWSSYLQVPGEVPRLFLSTQVGIHGERAQHMELT